MGLGIFNMNAGLFSCHFVEADLCCVGSRPRFDIACSVFVTGEEEQEWEKERRKGDSLSMKTTPITAPPFSPVVWIRSL